mgnify:FL=1
MKKWNDDIEQASRLAMARLNIEELAEQSYATLSQGEQKRVQIPRSIVHEPRLLILDEPCEGLDPVNRVLLLEDLTRYSELENTPSIIYVTHHIDEIRPWMHFTHLLKGGKTLQQDKSQQLMTSEYMKDTFGKACRINQVNGRYRLTIES